MRKCVFHTKVQRSTGVNGRISEHLLIRVVPPMISVPCGLKLLAVFYMRGIKSCASRYSLGKDEIIFTSCLHKK